MTLSDLTEDAPSVRLAAPPSRLAHPALFLDLDGVLAPFAQTPDGVVADGRRTAILKQLTRRMDGRVAIISGRTLPEIDRITDFAITAVSGVHGLQRRGPDGDETRLPPSDAIQEAVAAFQAFADTRPGILVEDKTVAVGLHYRRAPAERTAALELATELATKTGLSMQPGDQIVELKTPGTDKGTALTAFMQAPPFAGSVPVMVGDDLTDEYAFRAATTLGGFGILVGQPRETAARYGLTDVEAVLTWLDALEATQ